MLKVWIKSQGKVLNQTHCEHECMVLDGMAVSSYVMLQCISQEWFQLSMDITVIVKMMSLLGE